MIFRPLAAPSGVGTAGDPRLRRGCALSSVYGFLAGTWPFGVVEAVWAVIAVQRYRGVATER